MNARHFALLSGLAILISACGCDSKKAAPQDAATIVAMVDLDRVADEIGVNAKYQEYVLAYRDQLNKKLEEILLPMQQDIEKLQRDLNAKLDAIPAAERKKPDWKVPAALEQMYRKLIGEQQQMQSERLAGEGKLQEYDRKMKQEFQTAIQPALAAICRSKGVRVLVPRGASVFCEADADVTSALIAHLKANPIPPPAPPPGNP